MYFIFKEEYIFIIASVLSEINSLVILSANRSIQKNYLQELLNQLKFSFVFSLINVFRYLMHLSTFLIYKSFFINQYHFALRTIYLAYI